MSPQTTSTDEDLLIISDETSDTVSQDDSIEIALEDTSSKEIVQEESTIDFDSLESTDTTGTIDKKETENKEPVGIDVNLSEDKILEEVQNKDNTSELDFGLDLGTENESDESQEIPKKSIESTPNFSIENSGVVSEGMNTILAQTITKLESRQANIASEKDKKTSQVQNLKDQITKLEDEVTLHQGEIQELETESKKIATNIKGLEKMKLDEEVTKEHNAKRVPKK